MLKLFVILGFAAFVARFVLLVREHKIYLFFSSKEGNSLNCLHTYIFTRITLISSKMRQQ